MSREMKHSGIDWIGEIPKDWEVSRLKYYSSFINGFAFNSDVFTLEYGCKVIRIGDISQRLDFDGCVKANVKTESLQSYRIKNNDIVIAMSGATTGKCCIAHNVEEAYINQRVGIIRCKNYSYVYYLLQTDSFMEYIKLNNAGSAQPNVSGSSIGNYPLLVPPISEQQKIANYLDKVCGEVDEMIALQEQMIEELKAYKQSVITEAVTKGLNPDVPMKDSGIDWIGEIPEHWKLEPIKYCFGRRSEKNNPVKTKERLSLSIDKGVTLYAEKTTNLDRFKDDFTQYQLAYPNDIVLNCMNMIVGAVGLSKYMGCVSPVYYVIYTIKPEIDALYYSYLLNIPTIRGVYYSLGKGIYAIERGEGRVNTCRLKVSYDDFGRLNIPIPPIDEQKEITNFIQQKSSEIDALIAIKQLKIEELKDYKKSVIYEYVTGKKEVI